MSYPATTDTEPDMQSGGIKDLIYLLFKIKPSENTIPTAYYIIIL